MSDEISAKSDDEPTDDPKSDVAIEETNGSAPSQKSGSGSRLLIGLSLGIALVSLGVLGAVWQGVLTLGPAQDSSEIAALEARLNQLESSSENLDAAREKSIRDLRAQLTSIEADVAAAQSLDVQGEVAGIAQEFAALKNRIEEIETGPAASARLSQEDLIAARQELANMQRALQGVASHVDTVDRNLAKSDIRLEALEENAPPENLQGILNSLSAKSDVDALSQRLVSLEKYNSIEAAEQATIALAAADLSEASKGSAPFIIELDAFSVVAPGHSAARELRAFAVSGVPTHGVLESQFAPLVSQAIDAEKTDGAETLLERSWANFTTTFDVRRVGEVQGTSTKAVIARAEQRVSAGDLNAAASELDALTGPAAEVLGPWARDVRARSRVDALITKLNTSVMSELNETLQSAGG